MNMRRDGERQVGAHERAEERAGDQQATNSAEITAKTIEQVDEADAPRDGGELVLRRGLLALAACAAAALFELAAPVDRAAEADVERADDRADRGQHEHGGDRELDDPGDFGDVRLVCQAASLSRTVYGQFRAGRRRVALAACCAACVRL